MPVTVTNLLAGAGVLWRAPVAGAAEPATAQTAIAAPWIDLGATQDGVKVNVDRKFFELEIDQVVDKPGRRLTNREVTLTANLAEATLENWAIANDELVSLVVASGTLGTAAGVFTPTNDISAFNPGYSALIFEGFAPQSGPTGLRRRRVIARRVLSVDSVESSYKKDGQVLVPVKWATHYVSPTIAPYAIQEDRSTL